MSRASGSCLLPPGAFVPPLSTRGNTIVDSTGAVVKLACVNWYGFDQLDYVIGGLQVQTSQTIIDGIKAMGFNCIRMPWALEMYEEDRIVGSYTLTANPEFEGGSDSGARAWPI